MNSIKPSGEVAPGVPQNNQVETPESLNLPVAETPLVPETDSSKEKTGEPAMVIEEPGLELSQKMSQPPVESEPTESHQLGIEEGDVTDGPINTLEQASNLQKIINSLQE